MTEGDKDFLNSAKEQPKVTWSEMNDLIQPGQSGQKEINNVWLSNVVKTLSLGSQNRLNEQNLQDWLNIGDRKFADEEIPEEEWAKVGGLIDGKLTEIRKNRPAEEFKGENFKKKEDVASDFETSFSKLADEFKEFNKKEKFASEDIKAILEKQQQFWGKIQESSGEGFMQGTEKLPDPHEGVEELRNWFSKRIQALIHEYPDQSFETNWTLVWPLQQAINKLWPKEDEKDIFLAPADLKDAKGRSLKDPQGNILRGMKKDSYSALRKELAFELEAFRNIHNFRFIYRRVAGVGDVIGAAGLLENRYVEYLLHNKDIANSLRELETLGEEYKQSGDKSKIKDMEDVVDRNWQGKVASALYSALGRSWRHNLTLNGSGDFFCGRLFNMSDWAKIRWEEHWKRKPFPELYDALDLQVDDFWDEALKGLSKEEGEEKLKNLKIKFTYNNKTKKREYSFKSAKFEKLNFKELQLKNEKFTSDQMRQVVLDLEEADHIRKRILNPRGLLDEPGLQHIDGIYEEFKYLKGEKRSGWMEGVIKQIVFYFKDQRAPDIDDLPQKLRKCQAQEINSDYVGWSNRHIIAAVNGLTPPLTEKDKEELLTEVVGPKFLRGLKSVSKATVSVGGSAIFGAVKGFLGEFFKSILGGK